MSRTKRAYNRPGFHSHVAYSELEYHPYRQQSRHKCQYCYDFQRHKHLREEAKAATIRELNEYLDGRASGWKADDPLGHIYDIWFDYVEWEEDRS